MTRVASQGEWWWWCCVVSGPCMECTGKLRGADKMGVQYGKQSREFRDVVDR